MVENLALKLYILGNYTGNSGVLAWGAEYDAPSGCTIIKLAESAGSFDNAYKLGAIPNFGIGDISGGTDIKQGGGVDKKRGLNVTLAYQCGLLQALESAGAPLYGWKAEVLRYATSSPVVIFTGVLSGRSLISETEYELSFDAYSISTPVLLGDLVQSGDDTKMTPVIFGDMWNPDGTGMAKYEVTEDTFKTFSTEAGTNIIGTKNGVSYAITHQNGTKETAWLFTLNSSASNPKKELVLTLIGTHIVTATGGALDGTTKTFASASGELPFEYIKITGGTNNGLPYKTNSIAIVYNATSGIISSITIAIDNEVKDLDNPIISSLQIFNSTLKLARDVIETYSTDTGGTVTETPIPYTVTDKKTYSPYSIVGYKSNDAEIYISPEYYKNDKIIKSLTAKTPIVAEAKPKAILYIKGTQGDPFFGQYPANSETNFMQTNGRLSEVTSVTSDAIERINDTLFTSYAQEVIRNPYDNEYQQFAAVLSSDSFGDSDLCGIDCEFSYIRQRVPPIPINGTNRIVSFGFFVGYYDGSAFQCETVKVYTLSDTSQVCNKLIIRSTAQGRYSDSATNEVGVVDVLTTDGYTTTAKIPFPLSTDKDLPDYIKGVGARIFGVLWEVQVGYTSSTAALDVTIKINGVQSAKDLDIGSDTVIFSPTKGRTFGTGGATITQAEEAVESIKMCERWDNTDVTNRYKTNALINESTDYGGFGCEIIKANIGEASFQLEQDQAKSDDAILRLARDHNLMLWNNSAGEFSLGLFERLEGQITMREITQDIIIGNPSISKYIDAENVICEPTVSYNYDMGYERYKNKIEITNTDKASYADGYVIATGITETSALEEIWTLFRELYKKIGKINKQSSNQFELRTIKDANTAYRNLWRYAIMCDADKLTIQVPYEQWNDVYFGEHINVNLQFYTGGADREFIVTDYKTNRKKASVTITGVLLSASSLITTPKVQEIPLSTSKIQDKDLTTIKKQGV